MKRCSKCGHEKPLCEFYHNRSTADGRQTECKACRSEMMRDYRNRHSEKVRAYARAHKEELREAVRAYARKYPERVRETRRKWRHTPKGRAYRRAHAFNEAARKLLNAAVHDGTLLKPGHCEWCGQAVESRGLHGHHAWGYDEPVSVEWLCSACHTKAHRGSDDGRHCVSCGEYRPSEAYAQAGGGVCATCRKSVLLDLPINWGAHIRQHDALASYWDDEEC